MEIQLKEDFETIEQGTHYQLPEYKVIDGKGIEKTGNFIDLKFIRGSKLRDEDVEKREGTLHEHILSCLIEDLKYKNGLVPSRETSLAITKLQEGLQWIRERQIDRIKREVVGTYQK